ncbi:BnaA06g14750D [Brassica napus]|uniref:(rape) hypothetical protein n=1 Tax=Brassica napus TaxID=3708 RepID=A0A078GSN1_BRANA|nr:unnamed protein product [Brassica napus]CDY29495.1 BnaA06g14750D [Brassica napus]
MLELRDRECYLMFCFIVFMIAVPCYGHESESLFDGKTLYAGKELRKETLPLQSGSRVYRLQGLKSNSWYEVKISYPASIPALFSLQLLRNGEMGLKLKQTRRLLNTEKLIFKTESFEQVDDKDGLYVLVTVEPEGIVAIPNFKERSFIIYNIGKLFLTYLLLLSHQASLFLLKLTLVVTSSSVSPILSSNQRCLKILIVSRRSIWLITRMIFFSYIYISLHSDSFLMFVHLTLLNRLPPTGPSFKIPFPLTFFLFFNFLLFFSREILSL